MAELNVEKLGKRESHKQCIACSKFVNVSGENLYKVSIGGIFQCLCKDCLTVLRDIINVELEVNND